MSSFARCGVCDQEGQWSTPQYRDAWLRWHLDMTGHDDPFCMDFPEPTQEQKLRRPGDRSDSIDAAVRESIRKQREDKQ